MGSAEAPSPERAEQARNFALWLARGEPDRGAIAANAIAERVRELV
jgi:hypothetical protein